MAQSIMKHIINVSYTLFKFVNVNTFHKNIYYSGQVTELLFFVMCREAIVIIKVNAIDKLINSQLQWLHYQFINIY